MEDSLPSILIVDDEPHFAKLLEKLLEEEPCIIRTAATGGEALAEVARALPDLILLDVMMPGMDGYEVCRRLKADPASVNAPVIFITSLDTADHEAYGLSLGAEDFIRKPFSRPVVLARVRSQLLAFAAKRSLERRNEELDRLVAERTAALAKSQARLKRITDGLVEGVVVVTAAGRVIFANPAARRLLGIDGAIDGEGLPVEEVLTLVDASGVPAPIEAPWQESLRRGVMVGDDDAVFRTGAGTIVPVAYTCAPCAEEKGTAIVSFRDISLLKQVQREALEASRLTSIGQLAAGVTHEINTPIQYIRENLRYIGPAIENLLMVIDAGGKLVESVRRGTGLAEAAADYVQAVAVAELPALREELRMVMRESLEGVAQIIRIVSSMKELAHPGGAVKTAVDIHRALDTAVNVSRNAWKYVAKIERDDDPSLTPVPCHAGELTQVFLNLIVNAAQAIEASGKPYPGCITIRTRREGDWVKISVGDNGTGIPAAIRDKIFEHFFTTKPVGSGTGQGLSICRHVVEARHGGSITFSSEEGKGTVFTVSLPIEDSDSDGDTADISSAPATAFSG